VTPWHLCPTRHTRHFTAPDLGYKIAQAWLNPVNYNVYRALCRACTDYCTPILDVGDLKRRLIAAFIWSSAHHRRGNRPVARTHAHLCEIFDGRGRYFQILLRLWTVSNVLLITLLVKTSNKQQLLRHTVGPRESNMKSPYKSRIIINYWTATFPEIFNELLFLSIRWMRVQFLR